ncbi:protein kinase [Citricoccus sp. GCM10030269]|uniref:serine/threonine-protein kinase n=1 Tax=Citricoccus sp. GCM10030269 TaxID=3273388 RepID=UPI003614075B
MGQVIAGRFELASHIASGGSGSIWAAWDRRRNAWCAAKVLRHKDSGELLRFVREQGIQLDHRHLATPYGWAAEDEDVAISMPLVAGGTLDTALNDHGAFSSALTSALLLQLLDALDHVHSAGWIHRDVKPANILLEPTGEGAPHLRLGDFGIAVREDDPRFTMAGWVNGTPGYLAPEAMDLSAPAPAQDLYAAGVVALRMLDPSLKGERGIEAAVLNPRRTLNAIPAVDPRLAAVVAGLLDEEPERRETAARHAPGSLDTVARPQTDAGGYLTADGEPFVVFRQIPDDELQVSAAASGDASDGPVPAVASVRTPPMPSRSPHSGQRASSGPRAPTKPATSLAGRAHDLGPWILVVLGVAALVAAAFLLWPRGDSSAGGSGTTTPSTGSSPEATASPTSDDASPSPGSSGTGSTTASAGGQASSPQDSPSQNSRSQTSGSGGPTSPEPSPSVSSSVTSGQDCTWLEEGMVVTGADGDVLTCTNDGSGLHWAPSD